MLEKQSFRVEWFETTCLRPLNEDTGRERQVMKTCNESPCSPSSHPRYCQSALREQATAFRVLRMGPAASHVWSATRYYTHRTDQYSHPEEAELPVGENSSRNTKILVQSFPLTREDLKNRIKIRCRSRSNEQILIPRNLPEETKHRCRDYQNP